MANYKFDTQLLIEGNNLSCEKIKEHILKNIPGDCLLCVGDEDLLKIHFHTNYPGRVLEYCAKEGDVFEVIIENMSRQEKGLKG